MNETTKINNCERAGELVAYFYDEASRDERASFDAHLARCAACHDELNAFAGVREAVGGWHAEILKDAPAFAVTLAQATTPPRDEHERAPSISPSAVSLATRPTSGAAHLTSGAARSAALAALREFFALSPVWMRAGMAAAALVVCALAALAVVNAEVRWDKGSGIAFSTRLQGEAKRAQGEASDAKIPVQAGLDKLIAERDAALRELEDTRAQLDDSRAANLFAAVETLEPVSASTAEAPAPGNLQRERRNVAPPNARQPHRRRGADRDEEDAPRLYDLLIEAN